MQAHVRDSRPHAPPLRSRSRRADHDGEILRWERLGVAILPGPWGKKGPRERGWPTLPHEEAWCLAREAALAGPVNLAIRTGPTLDGTRHLGAIDLDGECPCEHDLNDHDRGEGACTAEARQEGICPCSRYRGARPDNALDELLALLPSTVAITKTSRGYHVIFWMFHPLPDGKLPKLSADVFGGLEPHALQVAPSLHPSGVLYQWYRAPGDDLPVVDLEGLGLAPEQSMKTPSTGRARTTGGGPLDPARPQIQREFAELMERIGVYRAGADQELHACPWHKDGEPSLSVAWKAALFHCFGCREGGSVRRLRSLLGASLPPGCDPSHRGTGALRRGLQLGGSEVSAERDRLADALEAEGEIERADRMRQCREGEWGAAESELEVFACPSGDSMPVHARTNSCDDPQCPECMPWRLGSDWRARWRRRVEEPPDGLTLAVVRAKGLSEGLEDRPYISRVRTQFREWCRSRGIEAGFYALTLLRDGDDWRAELLVAVSDEEADKLTDGRAFTVTVVAPGVDSPALIRFWQEAYLNEAAAWRTLDELRGFRLMTRGRRKFQGWGESFGGSGEQESKGPTEEEAGMRTEPLSRMSGGSGQSAKEKPTCPRCGEVLRRLGRFDPERMEVFTNEDGVREWRWRKQGRGDGDRTSERRGRRSD